MTYILEFSEKNVYLLAQLVHVHLQSDLAGPIGAETLSLLSVQTDCVQLAHEKHQVFSRGEYLTDSQPNKAIVPPFANLFYVPYENRDQLTKPW